MADYADFTRTMTRADIHKFRFTVKDRITGAIQDITNWQKFWVSVKVKPTDADPGLFQKTSSGGGIALITPTSGLAEGTIASADTNVAAVPYIRTTYLMGIRGKDPSGNIWTLARGQLVVLPEITRATS